MKVICQVPLCYFAPPLSFPSTMWRHFASSLTLCWRYLRFPCRSVSTGRLSEQPIRITLGGQAYQGSTDSLNTERPMDTGMGHCCTHNRHRLSYFSHSVSIWNYQCLVCILPYKEFCINIMSEWYCYFIQCKLKTSTLNSVWQRTKQLNFLFPKPLQVPAGWLRVGQRVLVLSFSPWVHRPTAALLLPAAIWAHDHAPPQVRTLHLSWASMKASELVTVRSRKAVRSS